MTNNEREEMKSKLLPSVLICGLCQAVLAQTPPQEPTTRSSEAPKKSVWTDVTDSKESDSSTPAPSSPPAQGSRSPRSSAWSDVTGIDQAGLGAELAGDIETVMRAVADEPPAEKEKAREFFQWADAQEFIRHSFDPAKVALKLFATWKRLPASEKTESRGSAGSLYFKTDLSDCYSRRKLIQSGSQRVKGVREWDYSKAQIPEAEREAFYRSFGQKFADRVLKERPKKSDLSEIFHELLRREHLPEPAKASKPTPIP